MFQCGDEERRFLPLAVATVRESELEVRSPLGLLCEEVDYGADVALVAAGTNVRAAS